MSNQEFSLGLRKLECFTRIDDVRCWLSRTRDLISSAEAYSFPAFLKSFREIRREWRKAEFALVLALYKLQRQLEEQATDTNSR